MVKGMKSLVENFVNECAFARTRSPRDADKHTDRNINVNGLQVVFAGTGDAQECPIQVTTFFGELNLSLAAHIKTRQRFGALNNGVKFTLNNDLSTVDTRSGSEFNNMICGANRAFIVFNDDNGVADVPQLSEGLYHFDIVFWV